MISMRKYVPLITVMVFGPIAFALVARDWGPYGQFAASAVIIIPVVLLAILQAGLADRPEHRHRTSYRPR